MVPLAVGLKYFMEICPDLDFYVGGGMTYSFLNIHDHSPYVHRHVTKNTIGGTAKAGLVYFFCDCWFIDASVDYIYQRFSFKQSHSEPYVVRHDLDMSGMKVGAGIGVAF
jgi:outer membrane protein W